LVNNFSNVKNVECLQENNFKYMSDFYQRTCQKCGGIRDPNVFSTVMSFGDNYVAITYGKRKGERAPKGCDD